MFLLYEFNTKVFLGINSPSESPEDGSISTKVSLLETRDESSLEVEKEISLEDEIKELASEDVTSLNEGGEELETNDELAWARVKGTTTMIVATIKDNEKYPNRLRR